MKNDPEFNIRFVKLVEKYPQLYNYTLETYANKQEVDRAWKEIALILNETVVNVVAKWTTLRNNFNRSLRESAKVGADAENKKCYYLAQYMQFLLPFFKSRNNERRERKIEIQETEYSQDRQIGVQPEEESSIREFGDDTFREEDATLTSGSESIEDSRRKSKRSASYAEVNKKPRTELKRNPDVAFFQSLLPLVEKLTDSEKIRFRISCMQTLQNIIDKDDCEAIPYKVHSIQSTSTQRDDHQHHQQQEIRRQSIDVSSDPTAMRLKFEL